MVLKMVYDITTIKNNLSMTADAVNGMMSAVNENEKVAWVTIYNVRMTEVFKEIDEKISKLEMPVPTKEEIQEVADTVKENHKKK